MNLPAIQSASHFLDNRKPHPRWLLENIIYVGTKEMLGGGSKTHKTWVQIDRAISIASGTPWLGIPTQKASVLFMNMEILESFFMERVEAVLAAKHLKASDCSLDIWHLRGFNRGYDEFFNAIEDALTRQPARYELVITDPIYKVYGDADENNAKDVAKLLNRVETFIQRTGCAITYSAHYTKGAQHEKYAIDRVSGSGVFGRDPDSITTLTRHKEHGCLSVDITLRNRPAMQPFVVEWEYPVMTRRVDLNPADLHRPTQRPVNAVEIDAVLDLLPDEGLTTTEWEKRVLEGLGLKKRAFMKKKAQLLTESLIVQDGKLWKPSPDEVISDVIFING